MFKGVIFDMDGVIIDSSGVHYGNWNSIFETRFNITLPKDEFASRFGESARHFTQYFIDKYNLGVTYEELFALIEANFHKLKHQIKLKPGIKELLPALRQKYKIALATGANMTAALHTVNYFNLSFDYIISGDMVKRAKPDPEIFLIAAKKLGLKPSECVVIEDAIMGVKAAKSAGMAVIWIPDEWTMNQENNIADLKLNSITELNDSVFQKLEDKNG